MAASQDMQQSLQARMLTQQALQGPSITSPVGFGNASPGFLLNVLCLKKRSFRDRLEALTSLVCIGEDLRQVVALPQDTIRYLFLCILMSSISAAKREKRPHDIELCKALDFYSANGEGRLEWRDSQFFLTVEHMPVDDDDWAQIKMKCADLLTQHSVREDDFIDAIPLFRHGLLSYYLDIHELLTSGIRFPDVDNRPSFDHFVVHASVYTILKNSPGVRGGIEAVGANLSSTTLVDPFERGLSPNVEQLVVEVDEIKKTVILSNFEAYLVLSKYIIVDVPHVNGSSYSAELRIMVDIQNDRAAARPISGVFQGTFSMRSMVEHMLWSLSKIGFPMDPPTTLPSDTVDEPEISSEYDLKIHDSSSSKEAFLRLLADGRFDGAYALIFSTEAGVGVRTYTSKGVNAFSSILTALTSIGSGAWDSVHGQVRSYVMRRLAKDAMANEDFRASFNRAHNMLIYDLPRGGRMRLMLSTFFLRARKMQRLTVPTQQSILSTGLLRILGIQYKKPIVMSDDGVFKVVPLSELGDSDLACLPETNPVSAGVVLIDYLEYALTIQCAMAVRNQEEHVFGVDVEDLLSHFLHGTSPIVGRILLNELFEKAKELRTAPEEHDESDDDDETRVLINGKLVSFEGKDWSEMMEEEEEDVSPGGGGGYTVSSDKISQYLIREGESSSAIDRDFTLSVLVAIFVRLNSF